MPGSACTRATISGRLRKGAVGFASQTSGEVTATAMEARSSTGSSGMGEHEGVAVGWAALQLLHANRAVGSGLVVHDDRLPK
ncbi:hypothetical protein [Paracraurococcus lichenis]|uniref:Uncharacterized protein n=1 Tax=Paracraurococcus lichenis TaxID=3064888 RepID=A0ABT9EAZ5_9PROT|nr:hypothetical protein [Paracraurococcus sp. LOR1-02]MDO9713307.1 hypothetical protein [Paracraurococcus sp. LOR1-02]